MRKHLDHEEKIQYLIYVIKSICEENNLNKKVIIEDFICILRSNLSAASEETLSDEGQ